MEEKCIWSDLFDDDDDKNSLEEGFFITGVISVALGLWLNISILMTNLRLNRSYRNLANFTMTACARRAVAMIPFAKLIGRSGEFQPYCHFFAFLETFLAVFEVEWLTHVCIERYVLAKYVTNGWQINQGHYTLFKSLCIFFATLYSFLPLFGIGRYGFDFSCTFCTFDMVLLDSWQMYFVVTIFFLRSIKPTAVMVMMLIWACVLEDNLKFTEENISRRNFTRNIVIITLLNLFCWTPIALLRGGVVLSQLLYSQPIVMTSVCYIKWAMWIHWETDLMMESIDAWVVELLNGEQQRHEILLTDLIACSKFHRDMADAPRVDFRRGNSSTVAPGVTVAALFLIDDGIRNKMLLKPSYHNNEKLIDDHHEKKEIYRITYDNKNGNNKIRSDEDLYEEYQQSSYK